MSTQPGPLEPELLAAQRAQIEALFTGNHRVHTLPPGANPGLVYDRFPRLWYRNVGQNPGSGRGAQPTTQNREPVWEPSFAPRGSRSFRQRFVERFCDEFNALAGSARHTNLIEALHIRQERLLRVLEAQRAADAPPRTAVIRTPLEARFMTGLGADHPLENGFHFDRHGLPGLPASAVKGLARQGAEQALGSLLGAHLEWGLQPEEATAVIERLFGPEEDERFLQGSVIFFDALPERWPRLAPDLLNPHYPDYYQGTELPGDWQDPKPVFFVTVVDTAFVFRLALRQGLPSLGGSRESSKPGNHDLEIAQACLAWGLEHLGMGAKTSAGYGRAGVRAKPQEVFGRERIELPIRVVTHAFAGATGTAPDPIWPLRTSTIRGHLRFWLRAMLGALVDPSQENGDTGLEHLRAIEGALFGWAGARTVDLRLGRGDVEEADAAADSSGQSTATEDVAGGQVRQRDPRLSARRSRVAVLKPAGEIKLESRVQPPLNSGERYAGYGIFEQAKERDGGSQRTAIAPTARERTITLRLELSGSPEEREILRDLLLAAAWLWLGFGGIGARSRKGLGALAASGEPTLPAGVQWKGPAFTHNARDSRSLHVWLGQGIGMLGDLVGRRVRELLRRMPGDWRRTRLGAGRQDFSTLADIKLVVLEGDGFPSADKALDQLGDLLQSFRSAMRRKNRRATPLRDLEEVRAFLKGMPNRPAAVPRAAFGLPLIFRFRKLNTATVTGHRHTRRASPLFFKVLPLANGRYAAVMLLMRGALLAPGEELKIESTGSKAYAPAPDDKLVLEFLDYAKQGGGGR